VSLSSELLKKYNVPGPRYTSYPAVPYWADVPAEQVWLDHIAKALDSSEKRGVGAAVYVHIPFCKSLCTYCGCNTRITRSTKVVGPYISAVLKEWGLYLDRLNRNITVSEIHLGGGTPTFLDSSQLEELVQGILAQSRLSKSVEFSIEADPRVTSFEQLKVLYNLGFRRLSLGVQDFDPIVQEIVHRVQSEELVLRLTEQARTLGYTSINFDLIYGLPLQTAQSVRNTLEAVKRLRPDRVAFYGYAHVPWIKPSQRRFTDSDIPTGEAKRELYEIGRRLLEGAGYREIGMDHFALETDSLWDATVQGTLHRNFMGYTSRQVAPLIGLGVSAIGDSWTAYSQNEKLIETYQNRVNQGEIPILRGHLLTEEDQIIRRHILNLMTQMETRWAEHSLQPSHLERIHGYLAGLEKDGLVVLSDAGCVITEKGRPFLRNICMAFDAHLSRLSSSTSLLSRSI
jgi:oxygen-independent coproporphyrinogen-3 oxidase